MFTLWYLVGGVRGDYARFDTEDQAKRAITRLLHVIHYGQPIRIRMEHKGVTLYSYERK